MIFKREIAKPFVYTIGAFLGFMTVIVAGIIAVGPPQKHAEAATAKPAEPERTYYRCPPNHVLVTRSDMFEKWMCIPGVGAEISNQPFPKEDQR